MMHTTVVLTLGLTGIFVSTLLALVSVGVFRSQRGSVSRSLAAIEAYGSAPPALLAELEPTFGDRVVTPLRAKTAAIGRKLTPADNVARIRHKLDIAGNPRGWTVDRVVSLKVVGFVVGLVGSIALA